MISPAELPLRDIHLPPPVSWWPPAPGWWLLLALPVATVAAIWIGRRARDRWRGRPRRRARRALAAVRARYAAEDDPQRLLRDLSACLRRVALTVEPRDRVAHLTGGAWLAWLDGHVDGRPFESGPGRVLAHGPYQRRCDVDGEALLSLCERTVDAMTRRRRPE